MDMFNVVLVCVGLALGSAVVILLFQNRLSDTEEKVESLRRLLAKK